MAFAHGKLTKILFNQYDLSPYLNSATISRSQELAETTTFSAAAKTFIAGFGDATVSCEGFWDGAASAVDTVFNTAIGSDTAYTLTISRNAADAPGDAAELASIKTTSYEIASGVNDVCSVSAEFQASGAVKSGQILHALEAETATAADSAVDGGAETTTGAFGHLHVTAASAADTLDVIIEDSANGTTGWATIGTFAQISAVGSERITIAGTVKQYTRASWTIAGSDPSFTFAVAIART